LEELTGRGRPTLGEFFHWKRKGAEQVEEWRIFSSQWLVGHQDNEMSGVTV
jgi:hypothetical protein